MKPADNKINITIQSLLIQNLCHLPSRNEFEDMLAKKEALLEHSNVQVTKTHKNIIKFIK